MLNKLQKIKKTMQKLGCVIGKCNRNLSTYLSLMPITDIGHGFMLEV